MANYTLKRRNAYRAVFLGKDGKPDVSQMVVLADLAKICKAQKTTLKYAADGSIDTVATVGQELTRCVWLRINQFLLLSDAEIYALLEEEKKLREESNNE